MPKIRSIKPEFFLDVDLWELNMKCRLAFIGLWCHADREGRLEDSPRRLKAVIFPYDKIDMDSVLQMLYPRFINRYEVNGKKYIQINNFLKHQRPHPHEPKSLIPRCNVKKLHEMSISTNVITGTLDKDEVDTYGTDTYGTDTYGIDGHRDKSRLPKIPPTLEDVKKYCLERGKNVDPQKWHDFYSSKGWMIGKNKMKDWKAAVRTWESNENGRSQRNNQRSHVGSAKPTPGKYGEGETIHT